MSKIKILPSLLAADVGNLRGGVLRAAESGADALHIDIMDPHFVPNISFGPDVVRMAKAAAPELYRNVHLMMLRPDRYLAPFAEAGAQTIQIHVEADCDIGNTLIRIREIGLRPAIAINPETDVIRLKEYLGIVDEVLVMTVHPGFGAQKFIGECLDKVRWIRARKPDLDIMVDGGVNGETAAECVRAGVNMLVSGSYLYKQADMKKAMEDMRNV
ncbi:MAG: ribulose-phosphate 3-epimerase [Kiritimatiellae bacterium]|nr:ribulose-phosphate 3-epimerase [Kiritimatiellia bacterium]